MADALARLRARRAERMDAAPSARSCGACDLCCTAPGIAELDKPPGVPCSNLCGAPGQSCSIYADRPPVCSGFRCLWRTTDRILPDWLHPAACGFLLAFNDPTKFPSVVTVHVDPARPDAWNNPWSKTVFAELADKWNCLVAIGQSPITSHIFCPNGTMIDLAAQTPEVRELLVRENGTIGAPMETFGPDQRPLIDHLNSTAFVWHLPPPPWA